MTSVCPPGNVTFNTQAQLDQFIIDYPNCTQIPGNVWIEGSDITDLSPLQNITSVGGYLVVENNAALTNVDGLNTITTLDADLTIRGNASLTNVDGLSGLTTISGWLTVDDNAVITDISGLDNVSSGIGNLVITDNPTLTVCDLPNFCSYLAGAGQRDISGNLGECINEQAVIDACNAPATGCLTASSSLPQWPSATFAPACTGTGEVIATDTWTGEYSKVNVTAGFQYTFSSSVVTDYVTISDENGNTVNTHGDSPLTWIAPANATVRFYLHLDDDCNWGDNTNRSRIVKCNDPLSVSDADLEGLTYYPNPVTDVLTLTFERNMDEVTVVNLMGQHVSLLTINASKADINMEGMPSGSYFIRVKADGVIRTLKVLKH
ncbi:Receptor L domain protein [compost metagenome]